MSSLLNNASVRRVQETLVRAGSGARVLALNETARSAQDAADSLGVELGASVKSLVFIAGTGPVMAPVAGDRRCDTDALAVLLAHDEKFRRAGADQVRQATGYAIGGVAPIGHPQPLRTVIDEGLRRFASVYAAAGHPHCAVPTTYSELQWLTGAIVSDTIGRRLSDKSH